MQINHNEVSFHTWKDKVLIRMLRNLNPQTLLMRMQNGVTTSKNTLAVLQKCKQRITIMIQQVLPQGRYPGKLKTCLSKNESWMFMVALFIIAKKWRQPKWTSTGECTYPYNRVLFNHKKEWRTDTYYKDEPWKHNEVAHGMTAFIWNV